MVSRRLRRRQLLLPTTPRVTLTPLIDTALVLLVIFMVTAPLVQQAIKVELPTGSMQETTNLPTPVELHIDATGNAYINTQKIAHDELLTTLKQLFAQRPDKTLVVKSDRAASYGAVIELIDTIKYEGIVTDIVLATERSVKTSKKARAS